MADVVVIGGGLAGLAAAARLAKARHHVTLLEAEQHLGSRWAPRTLDGIAVDAAPPIFSFPAPWRDLFRKSGRALEAEFTRAGAELVDAPPAHHSFADGTQFVLPVGRGDQDTALAERFGRPAADSWRNLIDGLGEVWQALRPLGVEAELASGDQLSRRVRKTLRHRRTLADLAADLDEPHLAAIVADLAYAAGSEPAKTPAFCAVQLYLDRTFGRWTAGSGTTMITTLVDRLTLRGVDIRTAARATGIVTGTDSITVTCAAPDGPTPIAADAVVATCDPRQLYGDLLPASAARHERRRLDRLPAARMPAVSLDWSPDQAGLSETVRHRSSDGPQIVYTRPAEDRVLQITYDYATGAGEPGTGVGWRGFRSWHDRPPISSEVPGLFTAGPSSAAGPAPSMQVLSGALAAYACQRLVAPDRPLEPR